VLIVLGLLLIAGTLVGLFVLDHMVKHAIEVGSTLSLGVKTTVADCDLSILSGTMAMNDLRIENPSDFSSESFITAGRFDIHLDPSTLDDDTIVVHGFELNCLNVNIEQKLSGSNAERILENLSRFEAQQAGQRVKLDRIMIRDLTGTFQMLKMKRFEVKIPQVELREVTKEHPLGLPISELSARIFSLVRKELMKKASSELPAKTVSEIKKWFQE